MASRIVAIGGRALDPDGRPLRELIVRLTGKERPRVCLLPTASGDDDANIVAFYAAFTADLCVPSHLELFGRPAKDLRGILLAQDAIYVGGGNTANMLAIWRVHGVDKILREAYDKGIVLSGTSAGCICWFEAGITDSFGVDLVPMRDGLGFLKGSCCPHYDSEEQRRPVYTRAVADGFPEGYAAEDGVALVFKDGAFVEAVTWRDSGQGYRVTPRGESAIRTRRA